MAGSTATSAQSFQPLERLEIVIWPEYDQPAALVMYRGYLPLDAEFPTTVVLPMPASVTTPNAVAKRPIGGDLLLTPYTIESSDGWQWAYIQTDAPEVRLEYYVELSTESSDRSFDFEWPGGPAVQTIAYEVMQPIGATDLVVSPSSGKPQLAADGLVYQREEMGGVPENGQFFIGIRYSKPTPGLTAVALSNLAPPPPATSPPTTSQTPAQPGVENPPPSTAESPSIWMTVLPVVLVAGVIVFWFVLRNPGARR